MKISVNLPEADVKFLDAQGQNRSATVHRAVELMRRRGLGIEYEEAFAEAQDERAMWDVTSNDGIQS